MFFFYLCVIPPLGIIPTTCTHTHIYIYIVWHHWFPGWGHPGKPGEWPDRCLQWVWCHETKGCQNGQVAHCPWKDNFGKQYQRYFHFIWCCYAWSDGQVFLLPGFGQLCVVFKSPRSNLSTRWARDLTLHTINSHCWVFQTSPSSIINISTTNGFMTNLWGTLWSSWVYCLFPLPLLSDWMFIGHWLVLCFRGKHILQLWSIASFGCSMVGSAPQNSDFTRSSPLCWPEWGAKSLQLLREHGMSLQVSTYVWVNLTWLRIPSLNVMQLGAFGVDSIACPWMLQGGLGREALEHVGTPSVEKKRIGQTDPTSHWSRYQFVWMLYLDLPARFKWWWPWQVSFAAALFRENMWRSSLACKLMCRHGMGGHCMNSSGSVVSLIITFWKYWNSREQHWN